MKAQMDPRLLHMGCGESLQPGRWAQGARNTGKHEEERVPRARSVEHKGGKHDEARR